MSLLETRTVRIPYRHSFICMYCNNSSLMCAHRPMGFIAKLADTSSWQCCMASGMFVRPLGWVSEWVCVWLDKWVSEQVSVFGWVSHTVLILAVAAVTSMWWPAVCHTILADVKLLEVQQLAYTGWQEHHIILTQVKILQQFKSAQAL